MAFNSEEWGIDLRMIWTNKRSFIAHKEKKKVILKKSDNQVSEPKKRSKCMCVLSEGDATSLSAKPSSTCFRFLWLLVWSVDFYLFSIYFLFWFMQLFWNNAVYNNSIWCLFYHSNEFICCTILRAIHFFIKRIVYHGTANELFSY